MIGAADRVGRANELIGTYEFEIYGTPSEETLAMLRQAPGVHVAVRPVGFGGYIRLGEI